jgi:hypothetical protein
MTSSIPDSEYFAISTQVSSKYVTPLNCPATAGHVPSSVEYLLRGRKKEIKRRKKEIKRREDVYVTFEKHHQCMISSMTVMHLHLCHTRCSEVR